MRKAVGSPCIQIPSDLRFNRRVRCARPHRPRVTPPPFATFTPPPCTLPLIYIRTPIFPISQHSCSHLVFFLPPNFFYSQHPVSIFSTVSLPLLLKSHTQHPLRSPSPDQWRPRTRNSLRRSRTLSPARSISWTPPLNPPPKTTNQLTSFWYAFITFEIISIWKILTQIHDFGTG